MRILLFGATGQVGREVLRRTPQGVKIVPVSRAEADLLNPLEVARAIAERPCDAVINSAAYTAVDRAEENQELALAINGAAPSAMAQAAATKGVPFLHISTDYVFDGGAGAPFKPDDEPRPLNAYGRSKLAGEEAIRSSGGAHVILRTSWVFSAHGQNFLKTMLRIGRERGSIRVVADQRGGPTPATSIADALLALASRISQDHAGETLHLSGAPDTSWANFARAIFATAGVDCQVEDIATREYPTPAKRPLDSRLECSALAAHSLARPDWRKALRDILKDLPTEE